jgi:hypothetical protein
VSSNTLSESDIIPREIKKAFVTAPTAISPEETLWRNVAARMCLDAYGTTLVKTDFEHGQVIRQARRWFRSQHAEDVFSMAGIDFARVVKQVSIDLKGDNDDEYFRRPRVKGKVPTSSN